MNIKIKLLGLVIAGALSLVVACSSSNEENNNPGASSSAGTGNSDGDSGGSSKSGSTSSSGGSSSNLGGSSSNNGGGGGRGGTTSGGFDPGDLGLGGAFDPADYMCNPKPKVGGDCQTGTKPCAADNLVCYCQSAKWACLDLASPLGEGGAPGNQVQCPPTMPKNGDSCGDGFGLCPYGQNSGCVCLGGTWTCQ
jgi:hypothetical protein